VGALRTATRSLGLARQILGTHATGTRPFKITWMLTERCDCRCEACFIWKREKGAEVTPEALGQVLATVPSLRWVNLTGGEPFLRSDMPELAEAVLRALPQLMVLDFPTTGQRTEAILAGCAEIARLGIPRLFVSVSLDGPPELHARLRGRPDAFDNAMRTYAALREMPGVRPYLGLTISDQNAHLIEDTLRAVQGRVPGVTWRDIHLNVFTESAHYYGNEASAVGAPVDLEEALREPLRAREGSWDPADAIEATYLRLLPQYLRTGRSPLPCRSLTAGLFVDARGDVYPCTVWDRKLGNVFETPLPEILASAQAEKTRQAIARDACPGCWSPCEAHPTIVSMAPKSLLRGTSAAGRGRA